MTTPDASACRIAIVGLACRVPGARHAGALWRLLRGGREATCWPDDDALRASGATDAELADPHYVRACLPLEDMEAFDAGFFGFSPRDAAVLDPQHRHFLECAWEAMEDAGHLPERFRGSIGVFAGCGMQAYLARHLLPNAALLQSMGLFLLRHTGNDKDFLATRLSYLLDLRGPSVSVQTACSTSLVAVHLAAQSLLAGECDMALAGGVSIELPHRRGYRWAPGEILSPDGHCRAFDDAAAGTLFGSGVGVVVLRRMEDALADGDAIHAVILGSAINNDGRGKAGYLAPGLDGQARCAAEALAMAGLDGRDIDYVEAHGTGTPLGDAIEVTALAQAYAAAAPGSLGLGSIKPSIGHLDTAAGVAGLIKVCLALRHGLLPASLNFSRPQAGLGDPRIPLRVVAQAQPWLPGPRPRRAAVNSLGVGGTNAHVVLEEPPARLPGEVPAGTHAAATDDWQLVLMSARSDASLEGLQSHWRDFLAEPPPGLRLADAAFTTQEGRRPFSHRLALVARDVSGLQSALDGAPGLRVSAMAREQPAPVAFLFPGGGAQYPGAGRELLRYPAFQEAVQECLAALPPDAPAALRERLFQPSGEAEEGLGDAGWLERPACAMPALCLLEIALARLWQSWGVEPAAVLGHSAGEHAAACVAGILSVADAMRMVCLRGRLFERTPPGGMLAVELPERELRAHVDALGLDIAAVNAPDLCVASGAQEDLALLAQRLQQAGVDFRRLRVGGAAHSRLLDGVVAPLREGLRDVTFQPARIRFLSAVTGEWIEPGQSTGLDYWLRHLRQPVRFGLAVRRLLADLPDAALLEAGPGQGLGALARLNGASPARLVLASTAKPGDPAGALPTLLASAGALWCHGAALAWPRLRGPGSSRRTFLPTYAFERVRHWVEAAEPLRAVELTATGGPPAAAPVQRLPVLDDWFQVLRWQSAPHAISALPQGPWLVIGADAPLGRGLLEALAAQGVPAVGVSHGAAFAQTAPDAFVVRPSCPQDFADLVDQLAGEQRLPGLIVHLGPLAPASTSDPAQPLALCATAFDSPVLLARALQRVEPQPGAAFLRLLLVTAGSQALQSQPAAAPQQALALGVCRVVPRELPGVRARLVDLDPLACSGAEAVAQVLAEAGVDAGPDLSAWRGGQRWHAVRARAPVPVEGRSSRIREGGAYLITGGLGDIGLAFADWLARTCRARLVLVSRRALPPRHEWRALAARGDGSPRTRLLARLVAMLDAGADIVTHCADVADAPAMAQVVADVLHRWGALHGVFHAAGELADAPLGLKPLADMHRLIAGKAGGALVLHRLLPQPLDLFAVCSSSSVELGVAGQADYVAANAVVEALALSRPDGLAIRWGAWADTGMAARAWGRVRSGVDTGHPLLGVQCGPDDAGGHAQDAGLQFEATYDPAALWVLDEHRVAGRPVLPGTAYVEIARAAMQCLHPGGGLELRQLVFEQAMVFDGPPRRVQVSLRPVAQGHEFIVRSRGPGEPEWTLHASATAQVFDGALQPAGGCDGPWEPGRVPQGGFDALSFGPRWNNLARMCLSSRPAVARLALPPEFEADLNQQQAHPALLDMAATFGLHLLPDIGRSDGLFVPVMIERVCLAAPLGARLTSRATLRGTPDPGLAVLDVALHDDDGQPLAWLEGFAMRAVVPALLAAREGPARALDPDRLSESVLAHGIRAQEAPAIFERLFRMHEPLVAVSSIDLPALLRRMDAPRPQASHVARREPPRTGAAAAAAAPGVDAGPVGAVEEAVAAIWRELLGTQAIGRDDDFFALGGHSLVAVRLFARIHRRFGVELPLATLFEAPTLARLASRIAQAAPGAVATEVTAEAVPVGPGAVEASAHAALADAPLVAPMPLPLDAAVPLPWTPLVEIHRGEPGRRPLFCVHGAGGNVLNFKPLSDRLGAQQPFYGLQAQGVDGRTPPHASIEAMAEQYLEAILAFAPDGPYRLAGYSGGGVIALEMARRLRAAGASVELLVMIDTLAPRAARARVPVLRKLWLLRQWSLRHALGWWSRRRSGRRDRERHALALARKSRGEALTPELADLHLFHNFLQAQERYEPQPWPGTLVLFKARDCDTQFLHAGPCLGWDTVVTGEIRVTPVAGSHFSLMTDPGLGELAQCLLQELARLDGQEPSAMAPVTAPAVWWRMPAGRAG